MPVLLVFKLRVRAARGQGEGAHDGLLCQLDFEGVVFVAFGSGQGEIGCLAEGFGRGRGAGEDAFGFGGTPGLVRYSAEARGRRT